MKKFLFLFLLILLTSEVKSQVSFQIGPGFQSYPEYANPEYANLEIKLGHFKNGNGRYLGFAMIGYANDSKEIWFADVFMEYEYDFIKNGRFRPYIASQFNIPVFTTMFALCSGDSSETEFLPIGISPSVGFNFFIFRRLGLSPRLNYHIFYDIVNNYVAGNFSFNINLYLMFGK